MARGLTDELVGDPPLGGGPSSASPPCVHDGSRYGDGSGDEFAELAPVLTDDGRRSRELENAGGGKSNDDSPGSDTAG